jgi:hypothetical protein
MAMMSDNAEVIQFAESLTHVWKRGKAVRNQAHRIFLMSYCYWGLSMCFP